MSFRENAPPDQEAALSVMVASSANLVATSKPSTKMFAVLIDNVTVGVCADFVPAVIRKNERQRMITGHFILYKQPDQRSFFLWMVLAGQSVLRAFKLLAANFVASARRITSVSNVLVRLTLF